MKRKPIQPIHLRTLEEQERYLKRHKLTGLGKVYAMLKWRQAVHTHEQKKVV